MKEWIIYIAYFVSWLWALVDIVKSDFRGEYNKIVWTMLVIFLPFIGTILYAMIGRKQKIGS